MIYLFIFSRYATVDVDIGNMLSSTDVDIFDKFFEVSNYMVEESSKTVRMGPSGTKYAGISDRVGQ